MGEEKMAFELTIEMVGLCLFVPDEKAGAVYVPMPSSEAGHEMDPHVARLVFDAAYLRPGSGELDGILALVPLERTELQLAATAPLTAAIPDLVVNVGDVASRPVLPDALRGDDPGGVITARAVLRSGAADGAASGACWSYPTPATRRHMSNRVYWAVGEVEGDGLELTLTPLAGGTGRALPRLYPIGGRIDLALYYTPREELPPEPASPGPPPVGTPAHHFAAFYTLFESPVAADPLPHYVGLSCNPHMNGGSPYTCMAAQSNPTP
jgi:hypothetical protein